MCRRSAVGTGGAVGADAVVTGDADVIRKADKLILPGVGAFKDARQKLKETGIDEVIINKAREGVPLLGICLALTVAHFIYAVYAYKHCSIIYFIGKELW